MRYRDHRGGLDESLETTVEVNRLGDLIAYLNRSLRDFGKEIDEILAALEEGTWLVEAGREP